MIDERAIISDSTLHNRSVPIDGTSRDLDCYSVYY